MEKENNWFHPMNITELNEKMKGSFQVDAINLVGSRRSKTTIGSVASEWMLQQCKELSLQNIHVIYITQELGISECLKRISGEVNLDYFHIVDEQDLTPINLELILLRFFKEFQEEPKFVFIESMELILSEDMENWKSEKELNNIMLYIESVMYRFNSIFLIGTLLNRTFEGVVDYETYYKAFDVVGHIGKKTKSFVVFNAEGKMMIIKQNGEFYHQLR